MSTAVAVAPAVNSGHEHEIWNRIRKAGTPQSQYKRNPESA
jgi:hypothetical protein